MLIMDSVVDILNFVQDRDFDLAMQRMITLWENFFEAPQFEEFNENTFGGNRATEEKAIMH
jgi:hypothetical protein